MSEDVTLLAIAAWVSSGVLGAWLLSYPGDGFNMRYVFGALTGPVALFIAILERIRT